jgi:Planctomycete cytochrome C.
MVEVLGRLHPALVHLPVGILVLAFVLQWFGSFQKAITVVLLLGGISAVLSCISGIILSKHDDYDPGLVNWHQVMGILTAVLCFVGWYIYKKYANVRMQWLVMVLLFVSVSVTGHLGGTLTHGEGYITAPMKDGGSEAEQTPIANVQEAMAYDEVIQPMLQRKCYSCHNANKRKGGLRMDAPDLLMKGGRNGKIIVTGNAGESEMIKRILLPKEHEDHMPPKEKPQLTEKEVALLHWWINSGAAFNKKVKELDQPENIQPVLASLQQPAVEEEKKLPDIPEEKVGAADEAAVQQLKDKGVMVLPVAQNNNYLMVNFVSARGITSKDMQLLLPLKKQLVWLKLGGIPVGDSAMAVIGKCTNLTRLQLDNTKITDAGLAQLAGLKQLRYVNLVGTRVTEKGVMALAGLDKLRSLYLYQTQVTAKEDLQKAFPKTQIDFGGYVVPVLESDTTRVVYKPR